MSATLKEIARLANVNISTVSRALNDSPLITQATKDRVLKVAEKLEYTPNSLARGLVSHKSETIGLILPKIFFLQGPFFSEILRGIEEVCEIRGYNILLASAAGKNKYKNFPFNLAHEKRIDGMLIINEEIEIDNLETLKKESTPYVLINRMVTDPGVNCVSADNHQGGAMATTHLIHSGHEKIAAITGDLSLASSRERLKGYKQALEKHGIPFRPHYIQEGLFETGIESGNECAEKLLGLVEPPTAIFAFSDELAIGVLQALKGRGIRIPDDIAVIGYDNIEYSAHIDPPLSTIKQDPFSIGTASAKLLLDLLEQKPNGTHQIRIPVDLIVRDSCGFKKSSGEQNPLM